ncbi:MAG: alpha/beta hydrolase [Proteobacteria bacterium]|nr:alpha/beta hydrolase [Pseudomonadota bacterium]
MEFSLRVALTAALIYVLFVGLMYVVQRKLQYFPDRTIYTPAAAGVAEMSVVQLTAADGVETVGWYHHPATDNAPTIVYFHGNAGSIGDRSGHVRLWLEAGYGVLLLSYRGYGASSGHPSEAGLYADGRAAIAYVLAQGIAADRLVLYGESLGTGVAVKMATEHDIAALVLEAPFTSATDVGAQAYRILPVRLMLKDRYDSISRITGINAPLLIIHGEADRTIPVSHGRKLLAAALEPKTGEFVPGAGHSDLRAFGANKIIMEYLAATIFRR